MNLWLSRGLDKYWTASIPLEHDLSRFLRPPEIGEIQVDSADRMYALGDVCVERTGSSTMAEGIVPTTTRFRIRITRNRRSGVAIGAVALFLLLAVPSASAFCSQSMLVDYLAPLKQLPPVRGPATTLPFGPKGIQLMRKGSSETLTRLGTNESTEPVGFALTFESPTGALSHRLGWLVKSRLVAFSPGGHRKVLAKKFVPVNWIRSGNRRNFTFQLPQKPGSYLVEVDFRRRSNGSRIERFGDYLQAITPSQETKLVLNATTFRPGETVSACLENYGTEPLSYGERFGIESKAVTGWSPASIQPNGPASAIGIITQPGMAAPLNSFAIPSNAPTGLYRYVWHGEDAPPGGPEGPEFSLSSEFQIEASG